MQGSRSWTRAAVSPAGSCSQSTAHTAVSCTGQWWHDYMTSLGAQESNLFTASKIYNNSMEAFIQPREHLQYLYANRTDVTCVIPSASCEPVLSPTLPFMIVYTFHLHQMFSCWQKSRLGPTCSCSAAREPAAACSAAARVGGTRAGRLLALVKSFL